MSQPANMPILILKHLDSPCHWKDNRTLKKWKGDDGAVRPVGHALLCRTHSTAMQRPLKSKDMLTRQGPPTLSEPSRSEQHFNQRGIMPLDNGIVQSVPQQVCLSLCLSHSSHPQHQIKLTSGQKVTQVYLPPWLEKGNQTMLYLSPLLPWQERS